MGKKKPAVMGTAFELILNPAKPEQVGGSKPGYTPASKPTAGSKPAPPKQQFQTKHDASCKPSGECLPCRDLACTAPHPRLLGAVAPDIGSKESPVCSPHGLPAFRKNGFWYFFNDEWLRVTAPRDQATYDNEWVPATTLKTGDDLVSIPVPAQPQSGAMSGGNVQAAPKKIAPNTPSQSSRREPLAVTPVVEDAGGKAMGCPAEAHDAEECNTVPILPGMYINAQGVAVPKVDLSGYQDATGGPRALNDGVVYYCRDGKHHFKGPLLVKIVPGPVGMSTHLKTCSICNKGAINDTWNTTTDKENTCDRCGNTLGVFYGYEVTDDAICFNCDRAAVETPKYKVVLVKARGW